MQTAVSPGLQPLQPGAHFLQVEVEASRAKPDRQEVHSQSVQPGAQSCICPLTMVALREPLNLLLKTACWPLTSDTLTTLHVAELLGLVQTYSLKRKF